MRRGLALALALALSGCVNPFAVPPTIDAHGGEEREHPDVAGGGAGPHCGNVTLDVRPPTARPGEPVDVIASVSNCGASELSVDRGLCPDEGSGFRLAIQRGLHEFHLHARDTPEAAALHDTPCVVAGSSVFGLPPARGGAVYAHVVTFRWNGTFASDPCWPAPAANETACLAYAPAQPGAHVLRASIVASGVTFRANATFVVEGDAPSPLDCSRAALDGLVLTIHACGRDITLDPGAACVEGYPVSLEIAREGRSWRLAANGSALTPTFCAPRPDERLVLAGTTATARFAWDGTLDGRPAEPGEYEVVARMRGRDGGEWEARGTRTVPDRTP